MHLLLFVCVLTSSNVSFKLYHENMNANGETCILDCLRLHVHCIKMIYRSWRVQNTVTAHTHHSIICSHSGFQLQRAVNRQFLLVPRCVRICVCLCVCTRQKEVGRQG